MSELRSNSSVERKNAYYCEDCQGYVVTIDRDKGVTRPTGELHKLEQPAHHVELGYDHSTGSRRVNSVKVRATGDPR